MGTVIPARAVVFVRPEPVLPLRPSLLSKTDAAFKLLMLQARKTGRSIYGSTRIQQELAEQEVYIGRDRIHRLRKELGLRRVPSVVSRHVV